MSKVITTTNIRIVPRDATFLNRKVGANGEIFYDQASNTLRLYDGKTVGGYSLAKDDLSNVEDSAFRDKVLSAGVSNGIPISPTPPTSASPGQQWFDSTSGNLYVYYSSFWIQIFPFDNVEQVSAIVFPQTPAVNDVFTVGAATWKWDGRVWTLTPSVGDLTVTGNFAVNGTVSGISLSDISDVNVSSVTNGQTLVYNSTTQTWQPGSSSTFGGGTITNPLIINNSTATTGTSSGALRVLGGVSIGDDLYVAGTITLEDETLDLKAGADLRLFNTANTFHVGFTAPDSLSANKIYVLPSADGSSGQFLRTNGAGVLSWASASGAGGGTPPGGLNTEIQFNDNNTFAGDSEFTFDRQLSIVTVPALVVSQTATINSTAASTSSSEGALTVAGGVGISGQINVAGSTNKFSGNVNSTSTLTGTIVVTGGVGISGNVHVGGKVTSEQLPTEAGHLTNKRYVDANILAFSVAFGA